MAYSTSNPPRLAIPALGTNSPNVWLYMSADAATMVRGADYIEDALALGMKVGDVVIQSSPAATVGHIYLVVTVDADGADLSDGTAIVATNT